jgi:hypothetical protein
MGGEVPHLTPSHSFLSCSSLCNQAPDSVIRGHFVGMYLSASAKAYASYGDMEQLTKVTQDH